MGSRERTAVASPYKTFDEVADAIDELGPLSFETDKANIVFVRASGRFEHDIIALRQSGLIVRRILISREMFEVAYGDFQSCIDHVLSNNAVGPEVEYAHVRDFPAGLKLEAFKLDKQRDYTRSEIDTIATLQMFGLRDRMVEEHPSAEAMIRFAFNVGFTGGRTFSAVQSLFHLEAAARESIYTKAKNREKGLKSGSANRRIERLELILAEIEVICAKNPDFCEFEELVLKAAFDRIIPEGTCGHRQFPSYCTALRSEEPFRSRLKKIFQKSLR